MCALAVLASGIVSCTSVHSSISRSADIAEADPNAHLNAGYIQAPTTLNPHRIASEVSAQSYLMPIYDRLTQMGSGENGPELMPMLATSWQFADDDLSAVFTLRPDVTFSDGEPLTAEAVKKTFDHALASDSTVKQLFSMIASVDVVGPLQVRFTTNRPASDLPYVLSGAAASIVSPEALDNPDLDVAPVGSGPYLASNVVLGDQVTYSRREGYWDKNAQSPRQITIRGITDENARINALRSGQLDLIFAFVTSYDQISNLGPSFYFHSFDPAATLSVYLNTDITDKALRQAMNYAIDRESISEGLLNGQCVPNAQPVAPGREGHLEDPPIVYSYSPDDARRLIAESGLVDPSVTIAVTSGAALQEKTAAAVEGQLEAVGIGVEIVKGDTLASTGRFASGEVEGYLTNRVLQPSMVQTLSRNFTKSNLFPGTPSAAFLRNLDELYLPSLTPDAKSARFQEAAAVLTEEAVDIFICSTPYQFAASNKVIGLESMVLPNFQSALDLRFVGKTE